MARSAGPMGRRRHRTCSSLIRRALWSIRAGSTMTPQAQTSDRVNYVAKALDEVLAGQTVSEPETRAYGCSVKYK